MAWSWLNTDNQDDPYRSLRTKSMSSNFGSNWATGSSLFPNSYISSTGSGNRSSVGFGSNWAQGSDMYPNSYVGGSTSSPSLASYGQSQMGNSWLSNAWDATKSAASSALDYLGQHVKVEAGNLGNELKSAASGAVKRKINSAFNPPPGNPLSKQLPAMYFANRQSIFDQDMRFNRDSYFNDLQMQTDSREKRANLNWHNMAMQQDRFNQSLNQRVQANKTLYPGLTPWELNSGSAAPVGSGGGSGVPGPVAYQPPAGAAQAQIENRKLQYSLNTQRAIADQNNRVAERIAAANNSTQLQSVNTSSYPNLVMAALASDKTPAEIGRIHAETAKSLEQTKLYTKQVQSQQLDNQIKSELAKLAPQFAKAKLTREQYSNIYTTTKSAAQELGLSPSSAAGAVGLFLFGGGSVAVAKKFGPRIASFLAAKLRSLLGRKRNPTHPEHITPRTKSWDSLKTPKNQQSYQRFRSKTSHIYEWL